MLLRRCISLYRIAIPIYMKNKSTSILPVSFYSTKKNFIQDGCMTLDNPDRHTEIRLLRKYKKRLEIIMSSISAQEDLSQIKINHISTTDNGGNLLIFWTAHDNLMDESKSNYIDCVLQSASGTIRQRLARENVHKKVPNLIFVRSPYDTKSTESLGQQSSDLYYIAKPNNVYGLPWDQYMDEITSKRNAGAEKISFSYSNSCGDRERPGATDMTKWAKMWREEHNAKLVAKRERRRNHQLVGLFSLNKELEEMN